MDLCVDYLVNSVCPAPRAPDLNHGQHSWVHQEMEEVKELVMLDNMSQQVFLSLVESVQPEGLKDDRLTYSEN